jgi:hypothetical protein
MVGALEMKVKGEVNEKMVVEEKEGEKERCQVGEGG